MERIPELKELLIKRIDFEQFLLDTLELDELKWSHDEVQLYCPFHNPRWREKKGKSPSLGINRSGKFNCFSAACGARGSNAVNFYEQYHDVEYEEALRDLYDKYVHPLVPDEEVAENHRVLLDTPSVLHYIHGRGISTETLKRFQIGWDGLRITFPIRNRFGLCENLRRYNPSRKAERKILSYGEGYGGLKLYPINVLLDPRNKDIILCEGEWDALLSIQKGFNAVTITGGAGSWADYLTPPFDDKNVAIVYDVNDADEAGQIGAMKVADYLKGTASSIRVVELPLSKRGGDLTDFFKDRENKPKDLRDLVRATDPIRSKRTKTKKKKEETGEFKGAAPFSFNAKEAKLVSLAEASGSKYYFTPICMDCLISGKNLSPYLLPLEVEVSCEGGKKSCNTCPHGLNGGTRMFKVPLKSKETLQLVGSTERSIRKVLADMFDLPAGCKYRFEVKSTFNIEELRLIPAVDFSDETGSYVVRRGFFVGHGIESNSTYRLYGYTVPDPRTQHAVHVLLKAHPVQDSLDNFKLTKREAKRIARMLRPDDDESVREKMDDIVEWEAEHVTSIKQRPDLHMGVDLVFHSPLQFYFNKEFVQKGWLELLVLGDTRCGKGYVAEGMVKFYRLGEVASGENCSFSGLVGGLQQSDKYWMITWGKIPLNDRRLVVLDEVNAIAQEDIGRMSRVRSEGIAEIVKIQSERTRARTRLIWLANPRSGRTLSTYNSGVEAVRELIGASEDISRFDFALTVASSEVPSDVINALRTKNKTAEDKYDQELMQKLVLWIWSRKSRQVRFTKAATRRILKLAIRLGKRYSPSIPLVQGENARIKLAKLSAAVASRLFSTDDEYNSIVVRKEHVNFVEEFMHEIYAKGSMAYDVYSKVDTARETLDDPQALRDVIDTLGAQVATFVEGMLEHRRITIDGLSDYIGRDRYAAKELVGQLVRMKCVSKDNTFYVKRPAFIQFLRTLRDELKRKERRR